MSAGEGGVDYGRAGDPGWTTIARRLEGAHKRGYGVLLSPDQVETTITRMQRGLKLIAAEAQRQAERRSEDEGEESEGPHVTERAMQLGERLRERLKHDVGYRLGAEEVGVVLWLVEGTARGR